MEIIYNIMMFFGSQNLFLHFAEQSLHCSKILQGKSALFHVCVEQSIKAQRICGAKMLRKLIEPPYFVVHIFVALQILLCKIIEP